MRTPLVKCGCWDSGPAPPAYRHLMRCLRATMEVIHTLPWGRIWSSARTATRASIAASTPSPSTCPVRTGTLGSSQRATAKRARIPSSRYRGVAPDERQTNIEPSSAARGGCGKPCPLSWPGRIRQVYGPTLGKCTFNPLKPGGGRRKRLQPSVLPAQKNALILGGIRPYPSFYLKMYIRYCYGLTAIDQSAKRYTIAPEHFPDGRNSWRISTSSSGCPKARSCSIFPPHAAPLTQEKRYDYLPAVSDTSRTRNLVEAVTVIARCVRRPSPRTPRRPPPRAGKSKVGRFLLRMVLDPLPPAVRGRRPHADRRAPSREDVQEPEKPASRSRSLKSAAEWPEFPRGGSPHSRAGEQVLRESTFRAHRSSDPLWSCIVVGEAWITRSSYGNGRCDRWPLTTLASGSWKITIVNRGNGVGREKLRKSSFEALLTALKRRKGHRVS